MLQAASMKAPNTTSTATATSSLIAQLQRAVAGVIRGKDEAIELALVALLGQGHLLIEDVPGVGKTTLAQALAHSFHCSFQRIQFTSDMLPSDVVGISVFNQAEQQFDFKPGPIFANIVLADEINRTTPKTQSALLEAMNEAQVTVDTRTHPLPQPFIEGRDFCLPDDFKQMVLPVFAHRVVVNARYATTQKKTAQAEAILAEIIESTAVPL